MKSLLAYLLHGSINTWTRILPVEQGGSTVLRIQLARPGPPAQLGAQR